MDIIQGFNAYLSKIQGKLTCTVIVDYSKVQVRNSYGAFTLYADDTQETDVTNDALVDYMEAVASMARRYDFDITGTIHEDTIELSSHGLMDEHHIHFQDVLPVDGYYDVGKERYHSAYGPTFPLSNIDITWHEPECMLHPETCEIIYQAINPQGIELYIPSHQVISKENNYDMAM